MSYGMWMLMGPGLDDGAWLQSYDVDAFDGGGEAVATINPDDALRFEDVAAVLETWKTQSSVRPLRPDGKPNRPLTTFTIQPKLLPGD